MPGGSVLGAAPRPQPGMTAGRPPVTGAAPVEATPNAPAPEPLANAGGAGVALLAPLSGPNAALGDALAKAAKLALAAPGSPVLDVRDTLGTPEGAAAATHAAIAAGAGIIIGPLTAAEAAAAGAEARTSGVPVLAFTSDPAQAQPGVWVLGLTPAQQLRRALAAAAAQGKTHVAAVLPESDFGHAMAAALEQTAQAASLAAPDIRFHDGKIATLNSLMRDISGYATRRGPIDAKIRAARARHDAEGRKEAAELIKTPIPPPPVDVVVLADIGEPLATLASLFPYYDLDAPAVQIIGPALWGVKQAVGDAPLAGAWFAAPDPAARAGFVDDYTKAYGAPPPGVADLAYDAAAIARVLAGSGGYSVAALCRPEGFAGVDGVMALQLDGTVRRGLALFRLDRGAASMVEPAPGSAAAAGF